MESKIYYPRVDQLSKEEYALLRKKTIGASDVASLFGVAFKKTLQELIAEKANPELTEEEKSIGDLPSVRKGNDLEPLILKKFIDLAGEDAIKPQDMYLISPGLTVNYDAITAIGRPVELKYVTTFGHKNWNTTEKGIIKKPEFISNKHDMEAYVRDMANYYGVPPYYYTQLQTQMYGLRAKEGYLCALFEKDWELRIYVIPQDEILWRNIPVRAMLAHREAFPDLYEETPDSTCNRDY